MFSFLEGWAYSLAGLCSISKKDRNGIKSNLKKLKKYPDTENLHLDILDMEAHTQINKADKTKAPSFLLMRNIID